MKKSLFILVLLFCATAICSAQILEKSASGKYRISTEKWESLSITIKPEAQKYNSCFAEAILNPDKKILVERSEKILKLKLLFKAKKEVKESFIIYNSSTKQISCVELKQQKEETSYLILFGIASLILMIISNALYKKSRTMSAVTAAVVTFFAVFAVAAAFAVAVTAAVVTFFAAVAAAFAAAFALVDKKHKDYKIFSIIFYIAMTIGIILSFI